MILPTPVQTVTIRTDRVLNRFDPRYALGAGIDGSELGETARIFTPGNLRAMRSAGLGGLSYRLRTELAGEAWHWNPKGRFSEGDRGYWTSDARPGRPFQRSFGYRLPRRGDTFDQANDDGYSRLTDGLTGTFWKSNPYLDDVRPQWAILDLGRDVTVDGIRIRWDSPYALRYRVEFWDGESEADFGTSRPGVWRAFPQGEVRGRGGDEVRHLGEVGHPIRYVRLWLLASSHTGPRSKDARDAKGFAIREVSLGRWSSGRIVDVVRHRPNHGQTACYVSSTDPWHRASDRDPKVEQPGLALVARSSVARGLPMLLPVPVLYGTPEDARALGHWLRASHIPVRGFEMGEEPDGQICMPEDYATLYLQMADALRPSFPRTVMGGPAFQTVESEFGGWALSPLKEREDRTWIERLVAFFRSRRRLGDFGFVSFEWYPFDAVWADPAPQLAKHRVLLHDALKRLRGRGVPPSMPLLMTEYGYSAFAGPAEVDLPGALLNLDLVGQFFSEGGRAAFLYGYSPAPLITEHKGQWGNLTLLLAGDDGQWHNRLPTYWAARMMTQDWCAASPHSGANAGARPPCLDLLETDSSHPLLAAYTVRRPDGHLSVLLLNKDPRNALTVRLARDSRNVGRGNLVQYSRRQYAWRADRDRGHPLRSLPPVRSHFAGTIHLPPYSFAVATF